jgi:Domain of unknown function (DUF4440)
MKKHLLVLFLLSSLPFFSQTKKDKIAHHIIALHQKKFDFMISKQFDSLSLILDADLKYIHSNGWVESKEDLLANLKSDKLVYKKVTVSETKVTLTNHVAIVSGKGLFSVILENVKIEIPLMYSEIYVKKRGKWLLLHRHANKL